MAAKLQKTQGVDFALAKVQDAADAVLSGLGAGLSALTDQVNGGSSLFAKISSAFWQAYGTNACPQAGNQKILGQSQGGGVFVTAYLPSGKSTISHNLGRPALGVRLITKFASFDLFVDPSETKSNQNRNQQVYVNSTASSAEAVVLEVM